MNKSKYIYLSAFFVALSIYPIANAYDPITEDLKVIKKNKKEVSWKINSEKSKLHFTIGANPNVTITGYFPNGISGNLLLNNEKSTGEFKVKIATLKSVNQLGKENPVRDMNVVESFFGTKNSSFAKDAVNRVWDSLTGVLDKGVQHASFKIKKVENLKMDSKTNANCVVKGDITLWGKINIPVDFPVKAEMKDNSLEILGDKPATFDLLKVLGDKRDIVFETLKAAGCPHDAGVKNEVSIYLDKIVFDKK